MSHCTHADETELIIGLDYPFKEEHLSGYREICEYVQTISGFKRVTIFKRDVNHGSSKNMNSLNQYAFSKYDAIIVTEDDNEFAPGFLDYMNKGLKMYRDCQDVTSISGFSGLFHRGKEDDATYFTYDNSAWGLGLWKDKEAEYAGINDVYYCDIIRSFRKSARVLSIYPMLFSMLLNMYQKGTRYGDTKRTCRNLMEKKYQLRPNKSLVRNWGNDGSGLNCRKIDKSFAKMELNSAPIFNLKIEEIRFSGNRIGLFCYGMKGGIPFALCKIVKLLFRRLIVIRKYLRTEMQAM